MGTKQKKSWRLLIPISLIFSVVFICSPHDIQLEKAFASSNNSHVALP